jgi:hypothetical protein
MTSVYIRGDGGTTQGLTRIRCKDEERELQDILSGNANLLPGDQIKPDDPRRWMLIKREMPVPDPISGANRWNIDFFFVDQAGMPTFVECKRYQDTRSRREVVGQMLEYAANGSQYWSAKLLRDAAEESAQRGRPTKTLLAALQGLQPDDVEAADEGEVIAAFFAKVADNLSKGRVRLVFFMEEAPTELKSIVRFLNDQMVDSEVWLVEARQFTDGKVTVVVPVLFGYTERAVAVKRPPEDDKPQAWDWGRFLADAQSRLAPARVALLEQTYSGLLGLRDLPLTYWFGKGRTVGQINLRYDRLAGKSFLTLQSSGRLWVTSDASYTGTPEVEAFRDRLKARLLERLNLSIPDASKQWWLDIGEWGPQSDTLIGVLRDVVTEWETRGASSVSSRAGVVAVMDTPDASSAKD